MKTFRSLSLGLLGPLRVHRRVGLVRTTRAARGSGAHFALAIWVEATNEEHEHQAAANGGGSSGQVGVGFGRTALFEQRRGVAAPLAGTSPGLVRRWGRHQRHRRYRTSCWSRRRGFRQPVTVAPLGGFIATTSCSRACRLAQAHLRGRITGAGAGGVQQSGHSRALYRRGSAPRR